MTPEENERYDRLIFDGARDLAVMYRKRPYGMFLELTHRGVPLKRSLKVMLAMVASDYHEDMYRGAMCDEGVIEALKDALRPLHGFSHS